MIVAVVGKGRNCPRDVWELAYDCGVAVAQGGHLLMTGGLGGVMLQAALGAAAHGGTVIGVLPDKREPDPAFPGIVVPTGMSEPNRNVVMGSCCAAMLALYGSHGTMQEVAVALDREIPVASVETDLWEPFGARHVRIDEVDEWLRSSVPAGR